MSSPQQPLRPLIKWAGGKSRLLKAYSGLLPAYESITAYVEPFFGGGALYCDLRNRSPHPRTYQINDSNVGLMSFYRAIRNQPTRFLAYLAPIETRYLALSKAGRKRYYYELREHYWAMPEHRMETAATLFFLQKTCFNGVWQTCKASKGRFGTPSGLMNESKVIDTERVLAWSAALQDTELTSVSFEQLKIAPGSVVYCDPPYRGGHTEYGQPFTDEDQLRLLAWCEALREQGSRVFLSNRDLGDGFFERWLPENCRVTPINVIYTAGRRLRTESGFEAKPAREFLAEF